MGEALLAPSLLCKLDVDMVLPRFHPLIGSTEPGVLYSTNFTHAHKQHTP